MNFEAKGYA